jgi:hypothetical protein
MSGWPSPQVRHVYRNRTGGMISTYSTTNGVCYRCVSSVTNAIPPGPTGATGPIETPNIVFAFSPHVTPFSFTWNIAGNGTVDYGDGIRIPVVPHVDYTGTVNPGALVSVYSNDVAELTIDNQPVTSIDITNAPQMGAIFCTNCRLTGGLNITKNSMLTYIDVTNNYLNGIYGAANCPLFHLEITNNFVTQVNADALASDLLKPVNSYGQPLQLDILIQKNGVILSKTTPAMTSLTSAGWSIS